MKRQGMCRAAAWGMFFHGIQRSRLRANRSRWGGSVRARLAPIHPAEPQR
jgi:hypothetical protein